MSERIIYCPQSKQDILTQIHYLPLGRLPEGLWAAVEDDALKAIVKTHPSDIRLLYFSRPDYEHAIHKLGADEVAGVIRKRLATWSPDALNHAIDWIYRRERRCLVLSALTSASAPPGEEALLEENFKRTLDLLSRLVGEGRYEDVVVTNMLVFTLEGEAKLIEETRNAQAVAHSHNAVATEQHCAASIERRLRYAQTVGSLLAHLGRTAYGKALPYVELERGVFIAPADNALIDGLRAEREPYTLWRQGLVTLSSLRLLKELEAQGKSVTVLYLRSGELLRDHQLLTTDQMEREFEDRIDAGAGTSLRAVEAYVMALELEQHLLRRNLLLCAHRSPAGLSSDAIQKLSDQGSEETAELRRSLAANPVWLEDEGAENATLAASTVAAPMKALRQQEQEVLADTVLFRDLCRAENREQLASRLEKIIQEMKRQMAR